MSDNFIDVDDYDAISDDKKINWSDAEHAAHDKEVRKRIDDLLEKKRLKELLDDEDDWDI
ncbi:MAG: hypothetical protein JKX78_15800 [Alteromonadaceae bacterium]|nr:hypothetical protein [Alteromonadaceae bacterium]